jgi:hypothetical protein
MCAEEARVPLELVEIAGYQIRNGSYLSLSKIS